MKTKKDYYFNVMARCAAFGCEAAAFLQDALQRFDPETLTARMKEMHAIENNADTLKHDMMRFLSREFMTPIEREDIVNLAQELDNVVDCLDDVMQRLYIHNIQVLRDDLDAFTAVIVRCTAALHAAVTEFAQFKKSQTIGEHIVTVNSLESEGDMLYLTAMRKLSTTETNPLSVFAWSQVYTGLENCLDACEHASDVIESVIMKNS
ncbi:MAG: DUF47 family protein [Christensenellaceae bacterium]|jgi:predicted phosphate transport protein (TIGR00153 family)|nr:DUF47 family protein [Christensenellaceae bacterium]